MQWWLFERAGKRRRRGAGNTAGMACGVIKSAELEGVEGRRGANALLRQAGVVGHMVVGRGGWRSGVSCQVGEQEPGAAYRGVGHEDGAGDLLAVAGPLGAAQEPLQ